MYNDPLPPPAPGPKPSSVGADGKTVGTVVEGGERGSGAGGQHTGGGTPSSGGGVNMLLAAHRRTELRPSLKSKLGAVNAENGK